MRWILVPSVIWHSSECKQAASCPSVVTARHPLHYQCDAPPSPTRPPPIPLFSLSLSPPLFPLKRVCGVRYVLVGGFNRLRRDLVGCWPQGPHRRGTSVAPPGYVRGAHARASATAAAATTAPSTAVAEVEAAPLSPDDPATVFIPAAQASNCEVYAAGGAVRIREVRTKRDGDGRSFRLYGDEMGVGGGNNKVVPQLRIRRRRRSRSPPCTLGSHQRW